MNIPLRAVYPGTGTLLLVLASIPAGLCVAQVPTATATEHFETLGTRSR